MTLQVSTKFKELILGSYSFKSIFDHGIIKLYDGTQPASADLHDSDSNVVAYVSSNGGVWSPAESANGLIYEQTGPYIVKPAAGPSWILTALLDGTATWFRIITNVGDTGEDSFDFPRIDGSVGTSGTDLILPSATLTAGQSNTINSFLYTIPPVVGA